MIHSLRKRLIRQRVQRETAKKVETRDAILWEVIPSQKVARVKIQGSDTLLQARYPENVRKSPEWLKPGSAVRVQHVGGNRNSVELVGCGLNVPTPVPGGSAEPTIGAGENCVLTGCQLYAAGGMTVRISTGTYRINDIPYTLSSNIVMTAGSNIVMTAGSPIVMGQSAGIVTISAASSSYRMDGIFVGIDGVIDYIVGTPDATNPQVPDTPAGHVLLGWVFVPGGTTEITQDLINYPFVEPFVSQMTATAALDRLTWSDSSTTITVEVLDQYGHGITGTRWIITATITDGTGTITSTGYTESGYSATFTYQRNNPKVDEICPVFIEFTLVQDTGIQMLAVLLLEDEFGALIFE